MAKGNFENIAIVGAGLLGGSLGLAVKSAWPAVRVVAVGHRQASLDAALQAGVADRATLDPADGVAGADLVILCTPVGRFARLLETILPALRRGVVLTDVGSTKAQVVRQAERILRGRAAFVGSHPMAGGEQRGVQFARADLFAGRLCILTPTARTSRPALRRVEAFWQAVGMFTTQLDPASHDKALARVSHLPHALAALLVNAQKPSELDLAGPGFADTTRIAGGDPAMWCEIFLTNRQAVLSATRQLSRQLEHFRTLLASKDAKGLERLLAKAQQARADMLARRLKQGRMEG